MYKVASGDRTVGILRQLVGMAKRATDDVPKPSAARRAMEMREQARQEAEKKQQDERNKQVAEANERADKAEETNDRLKGKLDSTRTKSDIGWTLAGAGGGGTLGAYGGGRLGRGWGNLRAEHKGIGNAYMEPLRWFQAPAGGTMPESIVLSPERMQTLQNLINSNPGITMDQFVVPRLNQTQTMGQTGAGAPLYNHGTNPFEPNNPIPHVSTDEYHTFRPAQGQAGAPVRTRGTPEVVSTNANVEKVLPRSSAQALNDMGVAQRNNYVRNFERGGQIGGGILMGTLGALGGNWASRALHGDDY
jgi:hypothetical protein